MMAYQKKSNLEHVAFRVKEIQWHIQFFKAALGMSMVKVDGQAEYPKQVCIRGGLQLIIGP